jgi:tetrahedral aminopeptidase
LLDLKEHLKTLVEAHGPSGHEEPVREVVRNAWRGLTDSMEQDGLGSLIAVKRATNPAFPVRKIMLAAHIDEIGLMVRDIVDGFIYVHSIGGVDQRVMLAQPVIVHGKRPLPGVVGTMPPHLLTAESRKKYPTFSEMVIDVGLPADEVAELVSLGDVITPDTPMIELLGNRVAGKAMDDRSCVAIITVCLDMLQSMQHVWDVYAVATVQEETGLLGATTAAYKVQPDVAIALDVTFAEQPGVDEDGSYALGDGPAIGLGPNFHDKLREEVLKVADYHEIKYQDEPAIYPGGTDAAAIQVSREGVPTLLIGVPVRNMHSPVETLDMTDIERAGRLLAHFIASLDADFMSTIDWDDWKKSDNDEKSAE